MELFSIEVILAAFLIFVRVSSLIMTAPFFSYSVFPVQVKIFFALITSILLYPAIPAQNVIISPDSGFLFILVTVLLEVLVGVVMGLTGQLIFAGLELAGRLISLKIVLAFADMIDTMTQQSSTIVGNLFTMLAVLVFISIDGDKVYLNALVRSFEVIPISQGEVHLAGPWLLEVATYLFVIGVQIASPFIIVLFLLDLSLAIFARIMPQANIMFISLPLKIGIGLLLLILVVPYLPVAFDMMFHRLFELLAGVIDLMTPS